MASSPDGRGSPQAFATTSLHGIKVRDGRQFAHALATRTDLVPTQRSHADMAHSSTSQYPSLGVPSSSRPLAITLPPAPRPALVLPRLSPSIRSQPRPDDSAMPLLRSTHGSEAARQESHAVVDLTGEDEEEPAPIPTVIDLSGSSPELANSTLHRRTTSVRRRSPEERRTPWDPNRRLPSLIRHPSSEIPGVSEQDARDAFELFTTLRPRPSPTRYTFTAAGTPPQPYDLTIDDDDFEDDLEYLGQITHPVPAAENPGQDDSQVEFVSERALEPPPRDDGGLAGFIGRNASSWLNMPGARAFNFTNITNILALGAAQAPDFQHRMHQQLQQQRQQSAQQQQRLLQRQQRRPGPTLNMPGALDYEATPFAVLRHVMEPVRPRSPVPLPKIDPPEAVETGFTRSPSEGEEVVCPSCGDELTVGETEMKRQVWVIKGCGHVYCGACVNNGKKSKGKAKAISNSGEAPVTRQISQCVVDGCRSKVQVRNVIQLFL